MSTGRHLPYTLMLNSVNAVLKSDVWLICALFSIYVHKISERVELLKCVTSSFITNIVDCRCLSRLCDCIVLSLNPAENSAEAHVRP